MLPKITEEVKQLSEHAEKMRVTRSKMIELIGSDRISFEDVLCLCRCVVDLTVQIEQLEDTANRRELLNLLNVFDDVAE